MRASGIGLLYLTLSTGIGGAAERVRFNRDVRPILSENCFHCHGQDESKRKADLRLDRKEEALAKNSDGVAAVTPGDPAASAILARMISKDPDEVMPPPDSHRSVTPEQVEVIRRWIAEGAEFETHWAFTPPVKAPAPEVSRADWARDEWDNLVLAALERKGLQPSPPAAPEIWLRRVSFDLTGLAATPEETTAFLADVRAKGDAAYPAAVDRLLASPRYGEQMTAQWMDIARYADTHGFNNDVTRSMWRWRDWVINAFNGNMPYDRFLTEQLAGDLLPDATFEQRLATGFGRNHVINSEGGIIDEEYRVEYVADRVRTLGMAWMGLTLECAKCHDHKFDPVSTKDYYRMFAFFNQVNEFGEDGRARNAAPLMAAPVEELRKHLADLDTAAAAAYLTIKEADLARWIAEAEKPAETPVPAPEGGVTLLAEETVFPGEKPRTIPAETWAASGGKPFTFAAWVKWDGGEAPLFSSMAYDRPESSTGHGEGMEARIDADGRLDARAAARWPAYTSRVVSDEKISPGKWCHVAVIFAGNSEASGFRLFVDGEESGARIASDGLTGGPGGGLARLGFTNEKIPARFKGAMAGVTGWPSAVDENALRNFVRDTAARRGYWKDRPDLLARAGRERADAEFAKTAAARRAALEEKHRLLRKAPSVMVMDELPQPRETRVLTRGRYDTPGETVTAGVPEALLGSWPAGAPKNRLGLAKWLTSASQPLTPRVVVNRFWMQLFGTGLVKTAEDFGFQGEYPSNPELLDTMAREFADGGWDVKAFLRRLVLSATYRQDSSWTGDAASDPENRMLARGPRVRLTAEEIRDQALAAGGLLKHHLGGPGVRPFQPEDLYKGVVVDAPYPSTTWEVSEGDDRFRRSMYTFWKRTVPHPVMLAFDMPDREFCTARRSVTNTPLQALALMNEPAFLAAAGHLGERMRREGGPDALGRVALGFRIVTGRDPSESEKAVLLRALARSRDEWTADPAGAEALLKASLLESPPGTSERAEAAACAVLGATLLNLDEAVTKS